MLKGRLRFGDGQAPSPFPSAIIPLERHFRTIARLSAAFPDVWHVPRRKPIHVETAAQVHQWEPLTMGRLISRLDYELSPPKLIASNLRWQLPSEHPLEKFRTPWQFLRVSRQL
jgi:hypothetical protein